MSIQKEPLFLKALPVMKQLEKNPFYEEESSSDEEVHQALAEIQTDVLKQEILTQIDQALETGNQELFIKLTEQLKELEK